MEAFFDDFEHGYYGDELGDELLTDEMMEEIHRDPVSEELCKKFVNTVENMYHSAAEAPIQPEGAGDPLAAHRDTGPITPLAPPEDEPEYRHVDEPYYEGPPELDEMDMPPYPEEDVPSGSAYPEPADGRSGHAGTGNVSDVLREAAARRTMGAPTLWDHEPGSTSSWLENPDKLHYYALREDGDGLTEVRHDDAADGTWLLLPGDEIPLDAAVKQIAPKLQNDYGALADTVASALSRFGAFSAEVARAGGGKGASSVVNFASQIAPMVVGGVCSEDMRRILMEECERSVPPIKGGLLDREERERREAERTARVRQHYADAMRLMAQSANMIYYGGDGDDVRNAGNVIYQDIMRRSAKRTFERALRGRDPEAMKQAAKLMAELSKRSGGEMHGNLMRLTSPDNMLGCCMIFNTMNPVMLTLYLGPILLPALLSALFWMREKNRLRSADHTVSDYRRLAVDITMAELSGSMGQVLAGLVKNGCDPREALTRLLAGTPKMETAFSEMCKLREEMLTRFPAGKQLSEEDKSRWNELLARYGQVKRQFYQQLGHEVDRSRGMAMVEGAMETQIEGKRISSVLCRNNVIAELAQARTAALAAGATEAELSQPYVPGQSRFSSHESETYVRMQNRYDMLRAEMDGTCDALNRCADIYSQGKLPPMHAPEPPTNAFRHIVADLAYTAVGTGDDAVRARTFLKNVMPLALPSFVSLERGAELKEMLAKEENRGNAEQYRRTVDMEILSLMRAELADLDRKRQSAPDNTLMRDDAFRMALLETQLGVMLTDKNVLRELSDSISYGEKELGKWAVGAINERFAAGDGQEGPLPVANYTDKDRIDGLERLAREVERWEENRSDKDKQKRPWDTMLKLDDKNAADSLPEINRHDVFAALSRIEAAHLFHNLAKDARAMPDEDVPYYEDMRAWQERETARGSDDTTRRGASILPLDMGPDANRYDRDAGEDRYDRQETPANGTGNEDPEEDGREYYGR